MSSRVWPALLLVAFAGCVRNARPDEKPQLSVEQISALIPDKVDDKEGWARELRVALETNGLDADLQNTCMVIAVVDQESGFKANPAVPNLPAITRKGLQEKAAAFGPLKGAVLEELLEAKAPGAKLTFNQRIDKLRTEADLDRFYRDLLAEQKRLHPMLFRAADLGARVLDDEDLDDRNPVTTAGSMQVSVRFAEDHAEKLGKKREGVRDELYTRQGGLLYGSARLLGYPSHDQPIHRFADYNAGRYASRNAAFQEQLSALTQTKLALDGDLLAWKSEDALRSTATKTAEALKAFGREHGLSESQVIRDAKREKSPELEQTETWRVLKAAYAKKTGKPPPYARLPEVTLESPKLSRKLTTAWFAENVQRRYAGCLARAE